jgi:hypothetical protein
MNRQIKLSAAIAALALAGAGSILVGCSTPGGKGAAATPKSALVERGGAELWAENCGHCHNSRSLDSLSDAQWEVAAMHMRVRANLTAQEHDKILAFLKSAN